MEISTYCEDDSCDKVTAKELFDLIERQQYRCALLGTELDPQTAQLDHIIPTAHGGSHTIDNVQWLSPEAHNAKGELTNEEFVSMCRRVIDHARLRPI